MTKKCIYIFTGAMLKSRKYEWQFKYSRKNWNLL